MQRKYTSGGRAIRIGCVIAWSVCLSGASASAQPVVNSISGTVSHNQTVVISGSLFGTKSSVAPLVWENFNDGALTSSLTAHGGITFNNNNNLRHPFSAYNARANFKVNPPGGDGYYFGYDGGTAPKWFVQYWIKLASNWHWGTTIPGAGDDGLANIKIFRMFPQGARNYSNAGYAIHGFDGGSLLRFVETGPQNYIDDARPWFASNTWHNVQVQYGENSGVDQNNGTMKIWIDGVLRDSTTTLNTNIGGDGSAINKRPYIIGFFDSWPASDAAVSNMYAYYTDIYVDDSWARVEICDANTYSACRLREIQVPTAWSSGSISVKVNQGAFVSGQTAYVYVVDSSGRVNANGIPVTISGTGGGSPAAPTNLRIVP